MRYSYCITCIYIICIQLYQINYITFTYQTEIKTVFPISWLPGQSVQCCGNSCWDIGYTTVTDKHTEACCQELGIWYVTTCDCLDYGAVRNIRRNKPTLLELTRMSVWVVILCIYNDSVLQRVLDASFDSHYLVFEISTQSIATGGTPPSEDLLDLQI